MPEPSGSRTLRLADAASMGMLITLRCHGCRRSASYWAADLVEVVGGRHPLPRTPFSCSRGCHPDMMSVRWHVPPASERGTLTVRRPVRQVKVWVWRNERA